MEVSLYVQNFTARASVFYNEFPPYCENVYVCTIRMREADTCFLLPHSVLNSLC